MNILIAGGTGLVGKKLASKLQKNGYTVAILTRNPKQSSLFANFKWDPQQNTIDPKAIEFANIVINLSGAGIADKKWTATRKTEIIESRTKSNQFLFDSFQNKQLDLYISASASGFYGNNTTHEALVETAAPGTDFMANVCNLWEKSAQQFQTKTRLAIVRIGVVLDKNGGMLAKLAPVTKLGLGAPLGSGKQYIPWIHVEDLTGIFLHIIQNQQLTGVFNAVAPHAQTNREFSKIMAQTFNRPFIAPKVRAFVLRAAMGEMADIVLNGANISANKIQNAGFKFKFSELKPALLDIYKQ